MWNILVLGLLTITCLQLTRTAWTWRKNYRLASNMGFPVYVSPIYLSDAWWMMLYPFLLPVMERLPKSWTNPWLPMAKIWQIWRAGHTPFAEAGTDSFVVATPNGNMLWTSDHAVISQFFTQHPKSGAPVEMLKFYDIWGPTVGSVEGEEWKTNRRVITAGFGTTINVTVWDETKRQTGMLIEHWMSKGAVVPHMQTWTSRLALHIITCGFFNMKLQWDDEETNKLVRSSPNHKMSFDQALMMMLRRLATVYITPRFLLNKLPFKMFEEASLGFKEVTHYFKELRAGAEADLEELAKKKHKTLLESIVLSGANPEFSGKRHLSDENVSGNLFFSLMAGHESTGGTLGFIFMLMAIYPEMQSKVRDQLDQQLGSRTKDEWIIERDYHALQSGYIGAVQKEVLSLWNPASFLVRKVYEPISVVDAQGQLHHIPKGTLEPIAIAIAAANRNPAIWDKPVRPDDKRAKTLDSSALFFNPNRWLGVNVDTPLHTKAEKQQEYPTWFAFGQGPRNCPGQAFAETEMTAAMATLFKDYSLELVVSPETLKRCNGDASKAWVETQEHAIRMLYDDVKQNLSISITNDLPIRVVRR